MISYKIPSRAVRAGNSWSNEVRAETKFVNPNEDFNRAAGVLAKRINARF